MASDKQIRTVIFGAAIVGLVAASALGSNVIDDGFKGPNINYNSNHDFDDWDEKDLVAQSRTLDKFTDIKVLGALQIKVTGGDQSVSVSTKEGQHEKVKTWVEGTTLYIDTTDDKKRHVKNMPVRMEITMNDLSGIDVEGAIDGRFEGITADDFWVEVEGASNMRLVGTCGSIKIRMAGASNIEADDLKCKNADIRLEGVGNIEAYASERVNARLEGMGNIDVSGGASDVTKNKDGFGAIDIH